MKPFSLILACITLLAHFVHHSVDAIGYDSGKCMQAAYEQIEGTKGAALGCTAGDATPRLTGWEGPTECVAGETVSINITSDIVMGSSKQDFVSYTNLDGGSALTGTSCAMATIPPADWDGVNVDGGPNDTRTGQARDTDSCLDIELTGGGGSKFTLRNYSFRENLRVACGSDVGGTVAINNCFGCKHHT